MLNDRTDRRLSLLADRLVELLKNADDPKAEMMAMADRLEDVGLSQFNPTSKTNPREFASAVIEDNPLMRDNLKSLPNTLQPKAFQSVDELTSALLPANESLS